MCIRVASALSRESQTKIAADVCCANHRVEQLRLLSKAEQAGLLSLAEKNGLTLTFIERSGLLSKAEALGLLSAASDRSVHLHFAHPYC